ncbi:MAG: hypothetical protein N4A45_04260 [Flavobacteriales bacterium]|nr:hypothetical protein [Flavobacteriales bacterium]
MLNRLISPYILRFFALVFAQVFILDEVYLGMELHPVIYLLFPLTMPPGEDKFKILLSSFTMALLIDIFLDTLGLHSSAMLLMILLRPIGLKSIRIKTLDINEEITIQKIPILSFSLYILTFTLVHQIYYIILSNLNIGAIVQWKYIFLNTILSSLIMVLIHIIFTKKNKR